VTTLFETDQGRIDFTDYINVAINFCPIMIDKKIGDRMSDKAAAI
jgi:hypothetical protein